MTDILGDIDQETSDTTKVAKRTSKLKDFDTLSREAMIALLKTYQGRLLMWDILSMCKIYSVGLGADTHWTAHRIGQRDIGIQVLEKVFAANPQAYIIMQQEAAQRDKDLKNA